MNDTDTAAKKNLIEQSSEVSLKDWDSNEWNQFHKNYYSYLCSLAKSYSLNTQDVDDVVQEVFIAMAHQFKAGRFDSSRGAMHSWVRQFAKWRMIDIIRRNKTKQKYFISGEDTLMENEPDENNDLEKKFEQEHHKEIMNQAMRNIANNKSKEYCIFYDMFINDLDNETIMAKYNATMSTIYLAKHRTLKKLKREMEKVELEMPQ